MKICGRCGKSKDRSEFNKDKYTKTGLRSQCKECMTEERKLMKDHYKKWRETPEKKEWYREYRKSRYNKDRGRISARNKSNHAVSSGAIDKLPCEHCGKEDNIEAHHHDYAKPLDVIWLCRPCHVKEHGNKPYGGEYEK